MDIVKAINLGDYQMLAQLEVSGPMYLMEEKTGIDSRNESFND